MNPRKTLSLILVAATAVAHGQIYTEAVGFVKMGNTNAGQPDGQGGTISAVPANTDVWLSTPLENELVFTGTVDSGDTGTGVITVSGSPGWTNGEFASAADPHIAIIGSGSEDGLRGVINSNDSNTLTVAITTPGDLSSLTLGDTIRIRKAWTLSNFFADSDITIGCQVLTFDETATGVDHASGPNESFVYFGAWFDGNSAPADNKILHPGEMFILRSPAATPVTDLTVFGDVSLAKKRVNIQKDGAGDEDMELAHSSALPTLVGDLSIPAGFGDLLLFADNDATGVDKVSGVANSLIYFGQWFDGNSTPVDATFVIPPGTGFKLRRAAASPAGPVEWTEDAD
ncbi:MAG: TIGR02597 family protein [Verrucomicrobiota bacterium]